MPILATQFLADLTRVAQLLGAGAHVLNACADRYHFTVGLAASLVSGKLSLLPSTHTPEVIRQLIAFAPDVVCLSDEADCGIDLPRVPFPGDATRFTGKPAPVPAIDTAQLAACVFTSGSTGTPVPYRKSWGRLIACVREEANRLGLSGSTCAIVATVPPQHMYGFESSVLLALGCGHALCAERPFYPADIAAVLCAVPRPRILVSTPIHLRALLESGTALPPADLIVSSTAPLTPQLAAEVEQRFNTRLLEIYGSTETGQISARRPTHTPEWRLWPGVTLSARDGETWAQGGHIEQPTRMCDVLEVTGEETFLLHGRVADLVNVAGKRSSLAPTKCTSEAPRRRSSLAESQRRSLAPRASELPRVVPARSPTMRIPIAKIKRDNSAVFDFPMLSTSDLADFSPLRSSAATFCTVSSYNDA